MSREAVGDRSLPTRTGDVVGRPVPGSAGSGARAPPAGPGPARRGGCRGDRPTTIGTRGRCPLRMSGGATASTTATARASATGRPAAPGPATPHPSASAPRHAARRDRRPGWRPGTTACCRRPAVGHRHLDGDVVTADPPRPRLPCLPIRRLAEHREPVQLWVAPRQLDRPWSRSSAPRTVSRAMIGATSRGATLAHRGCDDARRGGPLVRRHVARCARPARRPACTSQTKRSGSSNGNDDARALIAVERVEPGADGRGRDRPAAGHPVAARRPGGRG